MSPLHGTSSPQWCTMGRAARGINGKETVQLSAGELLIEDEVHSFTLSSGRSKIRLIENELFGPQLGGLT